jgi:hypothetical protein
MKKAIKSKQKAFRRLREHFSSTIRSTAQIISHEEKINDADLFADRRAL